MKYHELAELFPVMEKNELEELAADIRVNGQFYPIWIYEGKILDGRNRFAACLMADIKPVFDEYRGNDPLGFVVAHNIKRRNLTTAQRSAIAVRIEEIEATKAKARQVRKPESVKPNSAEQKGQARDKAAVAMRVGKQGVSDMKRLKKEAPDIFNRVLSGEIKSVQEAKREARKIPKDDWRQDERERKKLIESGETVIANYQKDQNLIGWAESIGLAVCVDRTSKFGNPFVLNADGDRNVVCEKYEKYYLPHKPSIQVSIKSLKGKLLCCHCYPEKCHAESLVKLAKRLK